MAPVVGACISVGFALWLLALGPWLANRFFDGLDGPVTRARRATDVCEFVDAVADFSIYAGFVVGVAVAMPQVRVAYRTGRTVAAHLKLCRQCGMKAAAHEMIKEALPQ